MIEQPDFDIARPFLQLVCRNFAINFLKILSNFILISSEKKIQEIIIYSAKQTFWKINVY